MFGGDLKAQREMFALLTYDVDRANRLYSWGSKSFIAWVAGTLPSYRDMFGGDALAKCVDGAKVLLLYYPSNKAFGSIRILSNPMASEVAWTLSTLRLTKHT